MSSYKGHKIEKNSQGLWVYSDSKELVSSNAWIKCGHCGLEVTEHGNDGCIGTLPNVMNACCGHGNINDAYVQFSDKKIIKGNEAIMHIEKFKTIRV